MSYILLALLLISCFLITLLIINHESKKDSITLPKESMESYETAIKNIADWNKGTYNPIINTHNNRS